MAVKRKAYGAGGKKPARPLGAHRTLVYCQDDAPSVYSEVYGWWCMDCDGGRDAEKAPTTKANADKYAKRHSAAHNTLKRTA